LPHSRPRCRCEERKRETREGIRNPFSCPSILDYIFHRPIKEAAGKREKRMRKGKGRERGDVAKRRRHDGGEINGAM